jgi:hypothetical protein
MKKSDVENLIRAKYPDADFGINDGSKTLVIGFYGAGSKGYTYRYTSYNELLQKLKIENFIYEWDYANIEKQLDYLLKLQSNDWIVKAEDSFFCDKDYRHSENNIAAHKREIERYKTVINNVQCGNMIIVH